MAIIGEIDDRAVENFTLVELPQYHGWIGEVNVVNPELNLSASEAFVYELRHA